MKAIIFRVFDHFANSPTNYCFFDTSLIASYQKGEENCLLDVSILTFELYVFTRKDLCFATCRQVVYEMFIVWIMRSILVEKNYISCYIWPRSFNQTVKCSLLDEKIVYQSLFGAPLTFSYFLLQGKVPCFACVSKSLARCLLSKAFRRPCPKSYISSYIWHKSFIQTVKCFFFKQLFFKASMARRSRLVTFYFKEKFWVLHVLASRLRDVYFKSVPKTLSKKIYLWFCLTQIVH